jgi:hypothetical protein
VDKKQEALVILQDTKKDIIERIRAGVKLELDFWDGRNNPPNLSEEEFRRLLPLISIGKANVSFAFRESRSGKKRSKR